MRQSRSIGKEPNFSRIILLSAILHLIFISVFAVPIKSRQKELMSYQVTLVGPLRTPPVIGTMPVPAKENTAASVKESVKKPVKLLPEKADMSLDPAEKLTKEIERLRAIKALSEKRESDKKKAQEIQIGKKESPGKIPEGIAGVRGEGYGKGIDTYYSLISRRIWQNWVYPGAQIPGLEIIISIKIDRDGRIISHGVEKFSGNILFDRSALKAISEASPLPPPPSGEIEIGVRFYL